MSSVETSGSAASAEAVTVDPLQTKAEAIIAEADQLIASMKTITDGAALQDVRNELNVVRAKLLDVVMVRHGVDRTTAALMDDFNDEFSRMAEAITPPKVVQGRPFPGTGRFVVGDNGGGFVDR